MFSLSYFKSGESQMDNENLMGDTVCYKISKEISEVCYRKTGE